MPPEAGGNSLRPGLPYKNIYTQIYWKLIKAIVYMSYCLHALHKSLFCNNTLLIFPFRRMSRFHIKSRVPGRAERMLPPWGQAIKKRLFIYFPARKSLSKVNKCISMYASLQLILCEVWNHTLFPVQCTCFGLSFCFVLSLLVKCFQCQSAIQ